MARTRPATMVMMSNGAPQYQPAFGASYQRLVTTPAYSTMVDAHGSRAWNLGPVNGSRPLGAAGTFLDPSIQLLPQGLEPGAHARTSMPARTGPMDPSYKVSFSADGSQGRSPPSSQDSEAPEIKHAKPQTVNGIEYWPEQWGITREQCLDLWNQLREDVESGDWNPDYNVYEFVQRRIIPLLKGKGMGYALFINQDDPKEVDIMVSHAWNENALEFLEAIIRSTIDGEVLFICAFSLYQCEDGAGPSISEQLGADPDESPFKRVLVHIAEKGRQSRLVEFCYKYRTKLFNACDLCGLAALCFLYAPPVFDGVVYTLNLSAQKLRTCLPGAVHPACMQEGDKLYSWQWGPIWPPFRLCWLLFFFFLLLWASMHIAFTFAPASKFYRGRMIVIPNRNGDLYARLWCVYEIFIARSLEVPCDLGRTMARLGLSSVKKATCTSLVDQTRIRQEIETMDGKGYDEIDKSITELTQQLKRGVFGLVCTLGIPNIYMGLAYYNLYDPSDCKAEFWGDTSGLILVIIGLVSAYYQVFKIGQGIASARALCTLAIVQLSLGIIFEVLRRIAKPLKAECVNYTGEMLPTPTLWKFFLAFVFGFSKAARMGFFSTAFFSFLGLAYTFFNRGPRAFVRHPCQWLVFYVAGIIYVILRANVFGKKRLLAEQWEDPNQAFAELFAIITEFMAGIGCPLNAIWKASVYWGLTVDWEDFWTKKGVAPEDFMEDTNLEAESELGREDREMEES